MRPVEALEAGMVEVNGKMQPAMLMTAAKSEDLEQMISRVRSVENSVSMDTMRSAVRAAADGLAEMHHHFKASSQDSKRARELSACCV